MIIDRLKARPIIVQLPLGQEDNFRGVIDIVQGKLLLYSGKADETPAVADITTAEQARYDEAHHKMIERLTEDDDHIMNAYLEGHTITEAEVKAAIRRLTLSGKGIPIFCGSALKNKGVQPLLDGVVDYLPSPLDMPPITAVTVKTGEKVARPVNDDAPFAALAFKIVADPFVGRLVYLRVYSGTIAAGAGVFNSTRSERERIGRLLIMHANRHEEITEADAGSIVAAMGLKETFTGDTLCPQDQPILLESIRFPEPVLSVAIEPKTRADRDKMIDGLTKLAEEDPTFKVAFNDETGQTVISGMGELHVEVLVSRLLSEYKVGANVGQPKVAYKETLAGSAKVEGRFVRQSGGHGQYGHVLVEFSPNEAGKGIEIDDSVRGGAIPREYIRAAMQGIREAIETGGIAGYPVVDIKANIYDGSYHEVDSSDMSFKMAGSLALKNGLARGKSVILEPIMKVEVVSPEQFLGDIIGDLSARRGRVEAIETRGDTATVHGIVPLARTFGYATDLRSMTQGRATYSLEFHQYQPLPSDLAEELKAEVSGSK
jgi:elongation factor G